MKTNKNLLLTGILGIALSGSILTGCKKDSTNPTSSSNSSDITSAQDESNASDAMNDSKTVSDAAAQGSASGEYRPEKNIKAIYSSHCTVTFNDTSAGPTDTMYVNFGPIPIQCNDLRFREGEIIVYWPRTGGTLLQAYLDSANSISMTFRNYAAGAAASDMIGISGIRTWINTGSNALSTENWKFNAALTLKYFATNQTATWSSVRTNTLVQIGGIYYYEITGSADGTDRNNVGYTLSIGSPLYVTAYPWWLGGCAWIESGTITVNVTNSLNQISINFGNVGSCDANAIATINGTNYPFVMW